MKLQDIKLRKINITALFDKIDQSQITSETIRNLFDLKPAEKANSLYTDLPGTKVLIVPSQRKEIVVEPNRLMVSDSSVDNPSKSKIVDDFRRVYETFLFYKITGQQNKTTQFSNSDEYFNNVLPIGLFRVVRNDSISYGQQSYIEKQLITQEQQKEQEWVELVGVDFYSLAKEKKDFLLKTAGIFDFGKEVDIRKVYETSIY